MTKLNPCPDCGREPDLEEHGKAFRVACWHCSSAEFITARTANGAMNAWNAATGDGTATQSGKTLRDEFAMAAMSGMLSNHSAFTEDSKIALAEHSYEIADVMLKERSK